MEYIRVVIVLLSIIVFPAAINAENNERERNIIPDAATEITMGKTTWGSFVKPIFCEHGSRVAGFRLRVQPSQGYFWDDSALNGIELACTNGKVTNKIVGVFGTWKEWVHCSGKLQNDSSKFVVGFNFRSEKSKRGRFVDNTAGNNVKMQCNDGSEMDGGGLDWGTWDSKVYNDCEDVVGKYFCGVQCRIQPNQGSGDDTGMNQIKFMCCGKALENLALGKVASQSSTDFIYTAKNAIDGNLDTFSETQTAIAWWKVDLGKPAIIHKVRLYAGDALSDFGWVQNTTVTVGENGDVTGMTSCGMFTVESRKQRRGGWVAYDITCDNAMVGRYIRVNKNSDNEMGLAINEFEAFGKYI